MWPALGRILSGHSDFDKKFQVRMQKISSLLRWIFANFSTVLDRRHVKSKNKAE